MSRSRLAGLSLALAIAGLVAGVARAETPEEMARDLVPAQKPIYDLGGVGPEAGAAVDTWVDRPERIYAIGQQLRVFVRPRETSYITVLNVGSSGRVAVIYPNFYQRDMQVRGGQTVSIPADGSSWKIDVAGPPGVDVIKVIASREPLNLPELLKLTGASAQQPILSLGRTGEEVARDLVPQMKNPGSGGNILPGGVRNLLVRIVPRRAAATFPHNEAPQLAGTFGLSLRPERAVYRIGEVVRVAVSVRRDCHLTLVGVGTSGKAVGLFPNPFQPDSFVRAGQTVVVPSPRAPYEFTAQGPAGVEGLLATCRGSGAVSSPSSASGGFAAVGDLASVTRDLAPTPAAVGGNVDVEQVSGSFLVIN